METRDSIIASAKNEFARFGFEGARVDRIARLAKVNKAMIYYHFGSKKRLYRAVIENQLSTKADFIEAILRQDLTIDEFVLQLASFYARVFSDNEFLPIFLRELASGGIQVKEIILKTISQKNLTAKLRNYFEAEMASGRIRRVNIEHAIISFIGMNVFYIAVASIANQIWEIENVEGFLSDRPRQVADIFLNGIKAK